MLMISDHESWFAQTVQFTSVLESHWLSFPFTLKSVVLGTTYFKIPPFTEVLLCAMHPSRCWITAESKGEKQILEAKWALVSSRFLCVERQSPPTGSLNTPSFATYSRLEDARLKVHGANKTAFSMGCCLHLVRSRRDQWWGLVRKGSLATQNLNFSLWSWFFAGAAWCYSLAAAPRSTHGSWSRTHTLVLKWLFVIFNL
jgi:hypothetical protein